MKKNWRLSASLINSFKACPTRCNAAYVLGIRTAEDTDSQRFGTNFHAILEVNGYTPGAVCPECAKTQHNPNCPLCQGEDILPDDIMEAVVTYLNATYAEVPVWKTKEEWETERVTLLYGICVSRFRWLQ